MTNRNGAVKTIKAAAHAPNRPAVNDPDMPKRAPGYTPVAAPAGGRGALDAWLPGALDGYRPAPGARNGGADIAARLAAYARKGSN
jgi:hypothetical protein